MFKLNDTEKRGLLLLRMIQSTSAGQVRKYFQGELNQSEYYVNDQELTGTFGGRIAKHIGLGTEVTKEAFY